jgi:hypothetical protein
MSFTTRKKKFEHIEKAYNESLAGSTFVYKTKYGGETFGVIKSVNVVSVMIFDKYSTDLFHHYVSSKKGLKSSKPVSKKETRFIAHRPEVRVTSTNGIVYSLDEIGIISKMKKTDGKN